eukprot:TRINITY_DN6023_c0_g1_i1.p1 TRINITY_DN6023_c0_g1~~TRINITY_DN6023_c0_g1_i1.p1  ORF type:complete len:222 (+),score=41.52 TRINITY_DN6023_c0_g1_i1:54-668(+)
MNCLYKIIIVGDSGCGKTAVTRRYAHDLYQHNWKPTIGVDFTMKTLTASEGTFTLQIWDVAGQERYGQMTRIYYQGAVGAIVLFDINRQHTFASVTKWKQDIDSKVFLSDDSPIPCVLVANKCDAAALSDFKTNEEMDAFCEENGFVAWFEASALKNVNIKASFSKLVENIVENDVDMSDKKNNPRKITIVDTPATNPRPRCKC